MPRERECFVCGCTDKRACPGGCAWSDKEFTITISGKKPRDVRRSICTRCAAVLEQLADHRKVLEVPEAERQAFELGAFAALRISNELRGGGQ